ncbi:MAG: 2-nitropropane dioxygenase [Bradyrhizobiaceae bacterium]|nr:MAG: 2-nitropropane dioxygenase [Bradyrhizobiaceae bacterium]
MWPDRRILQLFGIELPIVQAPMAGAVTTDLVIAVAEAGGLGSYPCAGLTPEQLRAELGVIRQRTARPINVNFFCHAPTAADAGREKVWRSRLAAYYAELGVDPHAPQAVRLPQPFDLALWDIVEEFRPEVVSFHFGLPRASDLDRVKSSGAKVISSATTVEEARWLEDHGCDAVIAQGYEAGGHRGMFLNRDLSDQIGTFALVPLVADAVRVPVIAAGGIADSRGVAAACVLGASAVQIGTAFLFTPEARVSPGHRAALQAGNHHHTAVANVFTGRPARAVVNRFVREQGPLSEDVPVFPAATRYLLPLRAKAETQGSSDFTPLWSGQAAPLSLSLPAADLTRRLAAGALDRLGTP